MKLVKSGRVIVFDRSDSLWFLITVLLKRVIKDREIAKRFIGIQSLSELEKLECLKHPWYNTIVIGFSGKSGVSFDQVAAVIENEKKGPPVIAWINENGVQTEENAHSSGSLFEDLALIASTSVADDSLFKSSCEQDPGNSLLLIHNRINMIPNALVWSLNRYLSLCGNILTVSVAEKIVQEIGRCYNGSLAAGLNCDILNHFTTQEIMLTKKVINEFVVAVDFRHLSEDDPKTANWFYLLSEFPVKICIGFYEQYSRVIKIFADRNEIDLGTFFESKEIPMVENQNNCVIIDLSHLDKILDVIKDFIPEKK